MQGRSRARRPGYFAGMGISSARGRQYGTAFQVLAKLSQAATLTVAASAVKAASRSRSVTPQRAACSPRSLSCTCRLAVLVNHAGRLLKKLVRIALAVHLRIGGLE